MHILRDISYKWLIGRWVVRIIIGYAVMAFFDPAWVDYAVLTWWLLWVWTDYVRYQHASALVEKILQDAFEQTMKEASEKEDARK
jgi:hypothetical protein